MTEQASPSPDRWHIDKGIGVAHILTTIGLVIGGMLYITGHDNRIAQNELNIRHLQSERIADQDRTEKKFDELKTDLRMINNKLDRLIESQSRGR